MRSFICFLTALAALSGLPAFGHPPMVHDCVAPVRPEDDQNDDLWQQFLGEIDTFQSCITLEADRHQAAADAHRQAAMDAVDDWNRFVRDSLNAPEDFPWPEPSVDR